MSASWVIDGLIEAGALDHRLGNRVERFVLADDEETARTLQVVLEYDVAPPRGGVFAGVSGVVTALVAHLPSMSPSARPYAVSLLAGIAGSLSYLAPDHPSRGLARDLIDALPGVAVLAQQGDLNLKSEFVDFAALCVNIDRSSKDQVEFYLRRLVAEVGSGALVEGAQRELDILRTS